MQNLFTVLVPLWNRSEYTEHWIEANYNKTYNFFFADGSKDNLNQLILSNYKSKNISYKKYDYDENYDCYINKIVDSLSRIKTPFVMICDNDDYLNFSGIDDSLEIMQEDKEVDFVVGNMLFAENIDNHLKLLDQRYQYKNLSNSFKNKFILFNMINPYKYVWYSVFKTEVVRQIWENIKNSKNFNFFTMEIFHTQIALSIANCQYINKCTYIKRVNPSSRVIENKKSNKSFIRSWLLNNKYLSEKFNIDPNILKNILLHYLKHIRGLNIKN